MAGIHFNYDTNLLPVFLFIHILHKSIILKLKLSIFQKPGFHNKFAHLLVKFALPLICASNYTSIIIGLKTKIGLIF